MERKVTHPAWPRAVIVQKVSDGILAADGIIFDLIVSQYTCEE